MSLRFLPEARPEFRSMPETEQDAMRNAVSKLVAAVDPLGFSRTVAAAARRFDAYEAERRR